jgi:hypothetical protein
MIDFQYITNGYYFRLIPNSTQAVDAYNDAYKQHDFDLSNIPFSAWASIKWQLKQAGYSVRKLPKQKPLTIKQLDKMLEELGG